MGGSYRGNGTAGAVGERDRGSGLSRRRGEKIKVWTGTEGGRRAWKTDVRMPSASGRSGAEEMEGCKRRKTTSEWLTARRGTDGSG